MRPPLAVLLLVGLLLTSGCLGFTEDPRPPSDQQALDTLDRSRTALDDVTAYRAVVNGMTEATSGDEQVTVPVSGESVVDVSNRTISGSIHVRDRDRRFYVTDWTAYSECPLSGWGRQGLPAADRWIDLTPAGEDLALLNRTAVYWQGTEQLDGTETAVIRAHPDEEEFEAGPNVVGIRPTDPDEVTIVNTTVTVWISTETWRPVRSQREMVLEKGGATATLNATWTFTEYNEPVNVTRPPIEESDVRSGGC